jgi:hypothetical protein
MSHGISKIIRKSFMDLGIINRILKDPYFETAALQGDFITKSTIQNDTHQAIFDFLDSESYDYQNYTVEYWFQDFRQYKTREQLLPHVDFNSKIWAKYQDTNDLNSFSKKHVMSPVTITTYLDVTEDMNGGELCISSFDWFNSNPFKPDIDYIKSQPYEIYKPKSGDVLYFNGSRYYHWVNEVLTGRRKSIQINFWTEDQLPPES